MYSHVACDVMEERTLYLLKPSSLIWHLMPYLFLFILVSGSPFVQHSAAIRAILVEGTMRKKSVKLF